MLFRSNEAPPHNWFSERPLFGRTVLVTRPAHQADELARLLEDLGARCLRQPAIEISAPDDWSAVDDALASDPLCNELFGVFHGRSLRGSI